MRNARLKSRANQRRSTKHLTAINTTNTKVKRQTGASTSIANRKALLSAVRVTRQRSSNKLKAELYNDMNDSSRGNVVVDQTFILRSDAKDPNGSMEVTTPTMEFKSTRAMTSTVTPIASSSTWEPIRRDSNRSKAKELERRWKSLIDSNKSKQLSPDAAIELQNLPNQLEVQKAYQLTRENKFAAKIFDDVCKAICQQIKSKSEKIRYVKTCRTSTSPEQVVFVATADCDVQISTEYEVTVCHPEGYSEEGMMVMNSDKRQKKQITQAESKDISTTIEEHSKRLFGEYSNIQMISGCSVKSRGFGNPSIRKNILVVKACIVIYVNKKGYIPIHEGPLPTQLTIPGTDRSLQVDVREGGVMLFSHPFEHHSHLKMGCRISDGHSAGTIGPIIERNGRTYCITCAHVFLDNPHQKKLVKKRPNNYIYRRSASDNSHDVAVYQGKCFETCPAVGVVDYIAYYSNGKGSSIDIAAIDITDHARQPNKGCFPTGNAEDAGYDRGYPVHYTSGRAYSEKEFNKQIQRGVMTVMKYGCTTEYTEGKIDILKGGTRTDHRVGCGKSKVYNTMYNQLSVEPARRPGPRFAWKGDSGALVLAKHNGDGADLRAVGIVTSGTPTGTVLVTPIWDILNHLKERRLFRGKSLKKFP